MANPRQRRKSRSSSYRPVSHSRKAKKNLKKTPPIRGPQVLQEAWDKQRTVRQNYARLGLVATLDPSAHGGVEKPLGQSTESSQKVSASGAMVNSTNDVPSGFGRICRDDAGNILSVDLHEGEDQDVSMSTEELEDVDSQIDPNVLRKWTKNFASSTSKVAAKDESVVKELEQISTTATGSTTLSLPFSGVSSRHVSSGEIKYLEPLVQRHGTNIEAMAGDLKRNPEQRTAGQLRRALRKAGLLTQ